MKRENKAPVYLMLFFLVVLISACQTDKPKVTLSAAEPAIDFDAVYVENEEPGDHIQILLKMSLKNVQGDILKFGVSTPEQHQQRLHYYMQNFKQQVQLVTATDTVPCLDSHFERLNMDLPYRNFVLTFQKSSITSEDQLLIDDPIFAKRIIQTSIRKKS